MLDTHARKQLLLTRIAAERQELTADLRQFRRSASLPSMLRSAVGPGFIADLLGKKSTRGSAQAGGAHWLTTAMSLMQRYRVVATLIGGVLPMLRRGNASRSAPRHARRGGRGLQRLLVAAVLGGAAFTGWKFSRPGAGGKLGA